MDEAFEHIFSKIFTYEYIIDTIPFDTTGCVGFGGVVMQRDFGSVKEGDTFAHITIDLFDNVIMFYKEEDDDEEHEIRMKFIMNIEPTE
jgi:hypothetical protein